MIHRSRSSHIYTSANATHQQDDVEKQIVAYTEALKIDPYFAPARLGLAEIYLGRGNLAEAAEQYRLVAKGPPPDPDAMLILAQDHDHDAAPRRQGKTRLGACG